MKNVLCIVSLLSVTASLYSAQNQSFSLIGKANATNFLTLCVADKIPYFRDQIDDSEESRHRNFYLQLPHADVNDLKHIESYTKVRADIIQSDRYKQDTINVYSASLSGAELLNLVISARMLFYTESVPLFLLPPLCKRMERADKTFPYSSLPKKVQDAMLKILLEQEGFAEKYRKAPEYWS